jgi:uncharacterized membrane protein
MCFDVIDRPRLYLLLIGSMLIADLSLSTSAKADIHFCNRTPMPIVTAIDHPDDNGQWLTEGWWTIWPGDCASVVAGPIHSDYIYVHAHSPGDAYTWGDENFSVCVSDRAFAFSADDCGPGPKRTARFMKVPTGAAGTLLADFSQDFTFDCDTCELPKISFDRNNQSAFVYHVASVVRENVQFAVPIQGYFSFRLDEQKHSVHVVANIYVDLQDVQRKFTPLIQSGFAVNDDCGDWLQVNNASISPAGDNANVYANATYEKWYCTSATLPQVSCEDTWIEVGPLKTKGLPDCSTWMETVQTSKNKIVQQSGNITISLRPSLNGPATVALQPNVEDVHLDGFGQQIAGLFNINLPNAAQDMLDGAVDPQILSFGAPQDLQDYMAFQSVAFYEENPGLGLKAHGEFDVSGTQIISLCQKFWSEGKCQSQ